MLTLRRLAELATMMLLAVPLFGCGDPAAPAATSQRSADAADAGAMQDVAPEGAVAIDRISRIEGRHFDLYRHYRAHAAAGGMDDGDDDDEDPTLRHAVISFSASSVSQALRGCSMRVLMALD